MFQNHKLLLGIIMKKALFLSFSLLTVSFSVMPAAAAIPVVAAAEAAATAATAATATVAAPVAAAVSVGTKAIGAGAATALIGGTALVAKALQAEESDASVAPMSKWEKVKASVQNAKTVASAKIATGVSATTSVVKNGYNYVHGKALAYPKTSIAAASVVVAGLGYAAYDYYTSENA